MKILLTNDDGIDAPGLIALRDELKKIASLVIVAPKFQKSATSAALTLYEPLILEKRKEKRIKCYSLTGTPVDCVKLAISKLFEKPPDLVISGINRGLNTGSLVLYSGTIAAALEANLLNLTSIAISLEDCERPDFKTAASISRKVVEFICKNFLDSKLVFNVNIPSGRKIKGIKVTKQDQFPFADIYYQRVDPRGRTYFWLRGNPEKWYKRVLNQKNTAPTDTQAILMGYVSITPLQRDLTYHQALNEMKKFDNLKF